MCSVRKLEDVGEREAVLLGEGDVDAVVGGGGLQLEVEAAAEALAQGEAPGLVEAAAEGRVEDELLAAAFVEEALGDDGGLGGDGAEDGAAGDDVGDELQGGGVRRRSTLLSQASAGVGLRGAVRRGSRISVEMSGHRSRRSEVAGRDVAGAVVDLGAEVADAVAEDGGALRGFAFPEGDAGRRAVGVFDEDLAGGSMRWMRQLVLPSRTTSPGEESTAKCSSSVAIWTFSGCSMTAKREVSGMAPPLEMAIMRAPRRGWRWPWTRSRRR